MQKRLAAILVAAALGMAMASSARAADMAVDGGSYGCNCDSSSGMVVVYDADPGVITRRWKTEDCDCRYVAHPRAFGQVVMPKTYPQYESLIEPWRR